MEHIPAELKYTESHEWCRENDEGHIVVGISDHAQQLLGDLVFVELPELNQEFKAGDEIAVVESVKAASDVYCPITGEVIEINEKLARNPELVNEDCYSEGWLFKLIPADRHELEELLDADAYTDIVGE